MQTTSKFHELIEAICDEFEITEETTVLEIICITNATSSAVSDAIHNRRESAREDETKRSLMGEI